MRVPFPVSIQIGDYEIGHAIANELTEKYSGGRFACSIHLAPTTTGFILLPSDAFKAANPDDAILAEAANILMRRGCINRDMLSR